MDYSLGLDWGSLSLKHVDFKQVMTKPTSMRVSIASLKEAVSALKQAERLGGMLILESPARLVDVQGTAWFLALVRQARQQVPDVPAQALVDAGGAAALALDALVQGADIVRIDAANPARDKLKDIADSLGARLELKRKKTR